MVVATVQIAHAIALEATLSFLGLGLPITEPSLGLLIANGYQVLLAGLYWMSVYPGLLLLALEEAARARGYTVLRMDTGPKHGHAVAFYESEGYRSIPDYNNNPLATWFGEKEL